MLALLALTPIVLVLHYGFDVDGTIVFVLAAGALVPLAAMIGDATENVSEHTGPGIGGFLNASFGNAPELIIALVAVSSGLPNVVRGSITGSVVSTCLLVLGVAIVAGGVGEIDRRSLGVQLALMLGAIALFLIPSVPGWHGDPDRHELYLLTLPVAAALLILYVVMTALNLRRHSELHVTPPADDAWSMRRAVIVLAAATVATAFVSEVLVSSLNAFGKSLGLSQFFVAAVVVALVGNAAEHGGALVVAQRGNARLAAEIAVSSPTQVAVFVAASVALLSGLVGKGLPLAFRPVEILTMAGAAIAVAVTIVDSRFKRWEGFALIGVYAVCVVSYLVAGDR
jgi:Ca2+:H+ antiporter